MRFTPALPLVLPSGRSLGNARSVAPPVPAVLAFAPPCPAPLRVVELIEELEAEGRL